MRIIAGSRKGRKLISPGKVEIRPTIDKVKGAFFNIIDPDIQKSSFLDLFAGTGSIGLEALSRGAQSVHFVESSSEAYSILQKNIDLSKFRLDKDKNVETARCEAIKAIKKRHADNHQYDFIYIDPPYHSDLYITIFKILNEFPIFKPSSIIIFEHFSKKLLPEKHEIFHLYRTNRYGDTSLSFYSTN